MQHAQHQTRSFPVRVSSAGKWQLAANTVLIAAAFVFVGAVTLGLFP